MGQLVVRGDDGAMAKRVKLRSAGTAKDLHHIQDAQVDKGASLGVVQLCALSAKRYRCSVYFAGDQREAGTCDVGRGHFLSGLQRTGV